MNDTTKSSDQWVAGGPISKDTFDKAVQIGQDLQKHNAFGSEQHKKGYNIVRDANIRFFGKDNLGEYGSF